MVQNLVNGFRTLIAATWSVAVAAIVVDEVVPDALPKVLDDAYTVYTAEAPSLSSALIIGSLAMAVVAGAAVSSVGLMLLKPWSRRLALWTTVVSVALYPALGAVIYSGWAAMLTEISTMLWGAALAMAYFSELRAYFEVSATKS